MKRFREPFTAIRLPFGVGVFYYPAPTKVAKEATTKGYISKFAPRLSYGVFMGYVLDPGHRWTGMYIVAEWKIS